MEISGPARLLVRSGLLDLEFYEALTGERFDSGDAAAEHAVTVGMPGRLSPHPLLDLASMPADVRRSWRAGRVRAVLAHLDSEAGRQRPSSPLFDPRVSGTSLVEFLAVAGPDTSLPVPASRPGRAPTLIEAHGALVATARGVAPQTPADRVPGRTSVVISMGGDLKATRTAVLAVLKSSGSADIEVVVVDDGADLRAALALTALYVGIDQVRLSRSRERPASTGDVVVFLDPETRVRRGWLAPLRDAFDDPEVAGAQPLILGPDDTIADAGGHLAGHPKEDAETLAGRLLPAPSKVARAVRATNLEPAAGYRFVPSSLVSYYGPALPAAALTVDRPGAGRLRWGLRLPSTAGPWGDDWGDTHFAESLKRGLQELGHHVVTHRLKAHDTPAAELDDVVLAIRGLVPIPPAPGRINLLWVISHPEDVDPEELAGYDVVFAASATWAQDMQARAGRPVLPLLQATEVDERAWATPDPVDEAVFVGGVADRERPMIDLAVEAGIPLAVHGHGWEHLPPGVLRSTHVPNRELAALYARHPLVIADHWPDMARDGFVANRVFDAVAAGAAVASDDVRGMGDDFGPEVRVCRSPADLRAAYDWAIETRGSAERLAAARRVVEQHSFRARARTLDATVRPLLPGGPAPTR